VERVGAERRARLHQLELTRRKLKKSVAAFEKDVLDNGIPDLQKRIDSRKAESEAGAQAGQIRAMPGGGLRATSQSLPPPLLTPASQPVKLVMDKIYRLPEKEKEERRDRAMELLRKFAEQ